MADYRRIVSYLYQYKDGRRGENVGFVRVQKAQERLKIVLNIKDKRQSEDLMLKIYFYIHKNGKLYGIFVDNIVLKEGNCEYKRAFLEREIFKNGEKIDDMHGMLLYYSREMSYGTEWDDKKIEVEQFILEQKRGRTEDKEGAGEKKKGSKEAYDRIKSMGSLDKKEIGVKEKKEVLSDGVEAGGNEERGNEERGGRKAINFLPSNYSDSSKKEQRVTDKIREQMKPELKMKLDREEEIEKRKKEERRKNKRDEMDRVNIDRANINRVNHQKSMSIKESKKEKEMRNLYSKYSESDTLQKAQEKFIRECELSQNNEENKRIGKIDVIKNNKKIESSERDKEQKKESNINKSLDQNAKSSAPSYLRENSINESLGSDISSNISLNKDLKIEREEKKIETKSSISMIHMQEKGEKDEIEIMLRDYPKIADIESEDLNDCVKIMPRDIGKMSTVNWWLRSNRLVLYRFEQYHYLLLGKRKNQDGSWQRVVGIPGIFDSKERYLASLFQFYCFIPTESKKYKTGSFGYWVTPIR